MQVKKHSGELVNYNPKALRNSLTKSGASESEVDNVFEAIKSKLYNGISTKELYDLAFNALKCIRKTYAARYSLKRALRDLGPEGFYFEKWRSEEHTSELQSRENLVCRLLLEKKKKKNRKHRRTGR